GWTIGREVVRGAMQVCIRQVQAGIEDSDAYTFAGVRHRSGRGADPLDPGRNKPGKGSIFGPLTKSRNRVIGCDRGYSGILREVLYFVRGNDSSPAVQRLVIKVVGI